MTISPDRYLVWWVSSALGETYEQRFDPDAAEERLDKLESRHDFVRGAVIDMSDGGTDNPAPTPTAL